MASEPKKVEATASQSPVSRAVIVARLREYADRQTGYIYADEVATLREAADLVDHLDPDVIEWVLTEARDNIAELADDLKRSYEPEKGWPPHIDKAAEMVAEIDDLLLNALTQTALPSPDSSPDVE